MKLSRPSRWGIFFLIWTIIIFANDLVEAITQQLVVIPIYHTGTLYFVWSDYLLVTLPVGFVALGFTYGYWRGSTV
jgi:hypothetical protein